ncbi:MAG: CinA family protein [Beijerinckiaceae bacterium]|nr:CinA family protein [Beijerinckiaceae bacterium]
MTSPTGTTVTTEALAVRVLEACRRHKSMLATAESCTGGMVAAALTGIAGSSDVVERGFVTYSNEAKCELLGVPAALIDRYGAVSAEVAAAMAEGALRHARAFVAVSVTGIAGPGGGSEAKPVGLVHFAAASGNGRLVRLERRYGSLGRSAIREAATADALRLVITLLDPDQATGGLP